MAVWRVGVPFVLASLLPVPCGVLLAVSMLPVTVVPPKTPVALRARAERTGGFTVNVADLLVASRTALILPAVETATASVVMLKLAKLLPLKTVTVAGVCAALLVLVIVMTVSAATTSFNVTVPIDVEVPVTLVGLSEMAMIPGVVVTAAEPDFGWNVASPANSTTRGCAPLVIATVTMSEARPLMFVLAVPTDTPSILNVNNLPDTVVLVSVRFTSPLTVTFVPA